jgi:hypothetical protein
MNNTPIKTEGHPSHGYKSRGKQKEKEKNKNNNTIIHIYIQNANHRNNIF